MYVYLNYHICVNEILIWLPFSFIVLWLKLCLTFNLDIKLGMTLYFNTFQVFKVWTKTPLKIKKKYPKISKLMSVKTKVKIK